MAPTFCDSLDNIAQLFTQLEINPGHIIIKFTATWCGPCKRAAPLIESHLKNLPETVHYYEIDVDDHFELYGYFKSKKMVNGVPALLHWKATNINFVPNQAVMGANESDINYFFENVK